MTGIGFRPSISSGSHQFPPAPPKSSIELVNGRVPTFTFNDGFVIDHLAFTAIPEPVTAALGLALGTLALAIRRRARG